jgi:hypothetical protein
MATPQNAAYWGQLGLIHPIPLIFGGLNWMAYSGQFMGSDGS